jgi:hypothetical protein
MSRFHLNQETCHLTTHLPVSIAHHQCIVRADSGINFTEVSRRTVQDMMASYGPASRDALRFWLGRHTDDIRCRFQLHSAIHCWIFCNRLNHILVTMFSLLSAKKGIRVAEHCNWVNGFLSQLINRVVVLVFLFVWNHTFSYIRIPTPYSYFTYGVPIKCPHSFLFSFMWLVPTYLRSWALLGEPPIVQPLKNFPAFHGTRRFNTVFTRALH